MCSVRSSHPHATKLALAVSKRFPTDSITDPASITSTNLFVDFGGLGEGGEWIAEQGSVQVSVGFREKEGVRTFPLEETCPESPPLDQHCCYDGGSDGMGEQEWHSETNGEMVAGDDHCQQKAT